MVLDPRIILQEYQENKLDKISAIQRLVTIINNSFDIKKRIEGIHSLESIGIEREHLFPFLENLMISDSNEKIRILATELIGKYFTKRAFEPLYWAYRHEGSLSCILSILSTLGKIKDHLVKQYLIKELKNTEVFDFRNSILKLMKQNDLENYQNKELSLMLINYHIIKFFIEKFKRITYKIEKGYITELDFSCIGHNIFNWNIIKEIPDFIGFLTHLSKLDLKINKIKKVPNSIGKLNMLNNLDLSNNIIQILPEAISLMISLKSLNLRHNDLKFLPDSFGKLQNLENLDLSHNKLDKLPQSFGNLEKLESLKLYGNYFEITPLELKKLRSLNQLELGLNEIHSIDKILIKIKSLKKLGLGGNNIDVRSLSKLKSLKYLEILNLYDNNIEQLPYSFGELFQIRQLSIHNNQLKELPKSFTNLEYLEYLDLSWNNFERMPDELFKLSSLKNINLCGNKISLIPKEISNQKNLRNLDLSYNQIQEIPNFLIKMKKSGINIKL